MKSDVALSAPEEMKGWMDYSSGVAWGTVALCIGVVVAYLSLLVGVALDAVSLPVGSLIATVLIYLGFTVAHEAGHGNIAHEVSWMKPYERLMGWAMTLLFIILPFGLFARIHDYHHAFTNDPDRDPDHWVSGDSWLEASWRAMTLPLHYLYLTVTRFKNDPVIEKTHVGSLVYYAITLPIVVGLIFTGYGLELLFIGVFPIFLASFVLGMLFDWIPHTPTRQQGRYQNTRSYLFPGLKVLTLGQNYHHIHHLYPRVTWYSYHKVFDLIRPELEAKNSPIEHLFSKDMPGFGQSRFALEPSSVDGIHKQTLTVEKVQNITDQSVAITFAPTNGKALDFKPGQYVTITKLVNGEPVTRCYSICSSPYVNELRVGVKKVDGGLLSSYLNNELKAGDELTVAGPFGEFIFDPSQNSETQPLMLIAGGSGITPVLSIAYAALNHSVERDVHLIFANRSKQDAMFLSELNTLKASYPDRFNVVHVLENAHEGWDGYKGYLDDFKLAEIMDGLDRIKEALFYICGPDAMKNVVVNHLNETHVPADQIFVEEFSQSEVEPDGERFAVKVSLASGLAYELSVAENQTVLQAAMNDGVKIPHACGVGQCGCCMMQVVEGQSELISEETPGLLPGEQESGFTLACQCRPKSDLVLKEMAEH